MKLHFFTVRSIEDYRKNFHRSGDVQKLAKVSKAATKEDFEQEFFYKFLKEIYAVPEGIYESRIYGDTGFPGLRLDFNFGLRLDVPEGNFRVRISDADSEVLIFDKYISGGRLLSVDQYFVRWKVEVFLDDEKIFSHTLNLEGQPVTIMFRRNALGDFLSFLRFLREFRRIHRCKLSICLPDKFSELVAQIYPDIPQIEELDFQTYATYYPLMMMMPLPIVPADTRVMPMELEAGSILGINWLPPKGVFKPSEPPVTEDPYVCIAVQAAVTRKSWLWEGGWDIVVDYLKSLGYRVFCIDKEPERTNDGYTIKKPDGAEDFTGNRPLLDRANMLYHAEFFIGLSSGLSWLADVVDCPVVMIGGFSQDWFEFYTPYRVANRLVCNGCLNDIRVAYLSDEGCPYFKDTDRRFECQKKISPLMVINAIERLIVDQGLTPPALR